MKSLRGMQYITEEEQIDGQRDGRTDGRKEGLLDLRIDRYLNSVKG